MSGSSTNVPSHAGNSWHQHRQRLRSFLTPDGRRIHIVQSPDESELLRKKLSTTEASLEPFDIHILGSPEHVSGVPSCYCWRRCSHLLLSILRALFKAVKTAV